jgi:GAF domain-containing protein
MSNQLQASYINLEQRVAERTEELEQLTKQLALLNAISVNVHESLDLSETLRRVLDETLDILNLETGSVFLVDEERDELVVRAHYGLSAEYLRQAGRIKIGVVLPESSILTGEPVIVEDLLANPNYPLSRKEGLRTLAIFPLRAKEKLLGTLGLGTRREPRHFTRQEQELLRAISDQVAVAIDHARLYNETIRRVDEIETLFAVQQAITSRLDLNSVLQLIADEARRLTSAQGALVFLLEGEELRLSISSGQINADVPIGYRMPVVGSALGLYSLRIRSCIFSRFLPGKMQEVTLN